MSCQARRHQDQMACGPCGVQWDVDDPEPPACGLHCVGAAARDRDPDASKAYATIFRCGNLPIGNGIMDRDADDYLGEDFTIDPDNVRHTLIMD